MAQWISIEEAAAKYGFETEYIWVLIEMREITVDYERPGIDIISDDSVQEFMSRNEKRDYLDVYRKTGTLLHR